MKYIQINALLDLKKDEIIGIQRTDDTENCSVVTVAGTFSCSWPRTTLLKMLETDDGELKVKPAGNLFGVGQHFAG